jgi:hypothetical protein
LNAPFEEHAVKESDWQKCADPLLLLGEVSELGVSFRKCRLFCVAYCRHFFGRHLAAPQREALEVAEAYADDQASKYRLRKAQTLAAQEIRDAQSSWRAYIATVHAIAATNPGRNAELLLGNPNTRPSRDKRQQAARLVREIFGYPFSQLEEVPRERQVVQLAESIYQARSFDLMPILADALEEAGCTEPLILAHCRAEQKHHRGCWVVDRLLSRD